MIVVEHDMEFVRRLGVKVTVLHEGSVLAEGTHRRGERQRARGGGLSGAVDADVIRGIRALRLSGGRPGPMGDSLAVIWCAPPLRVSRLGLRATCRDRQVERWRAVLTVENIDLLLRRGAGAAPRVGGGRGRQDHLRARPQRRRQELAAARHRRPPAGQRGQHPVRRPGHHAAQGLRARAARHRLRAAGPRDFPAADRAENLETGFAPLPRAERKIPDELFELFPVLKSMLRPARRRSVRRPAAAARDRPRAGHAAEAARARRADRRHPAVHHQGYRPRHHASCATRADGHRCWSSSISISPASWPTATP